LNLSHTDTNRAGKEKLQTALPKCEIWP